MAFPPSSSLPKSTNSSSSSLNCFTASSSFATLALDSGFKSLCEFLLVGLTISCRSALKISWPVLVSLIPFLVFKYWS